MKITVFTLLLFGLVLARDAAGQSGTRTGSFDMQGVDELTLFVDAGMSITITGGTGTNLEYTYEFDGNKLAYERFFENFNPEFSRSGGSADFNIDFPDRRQKNKTIKVERHSLELLIPASLAFRIESEYSTITINNIERGVTVLNRSGNIQLNNIQQGLYVENEYGNITVRNVDGETSLNSRSSNIIASGITGLLEIDAAYCSIEMDNIDGEIGISNQSGVITLRDIRGSVDVTSDYTTFDIANITGNVTIGTKSGKITAVNAFSLEVSGMYTSVNARDIGGDVRIESRSAAIILENIDGRVGIEGGYLTMDLKSIRQNVLTYTKSGKINAHNLKKGFLFEGSYTTINLVAFEGSHIDIQNQSGEIEIETSSLFEDIQIENTFGGILIALGSTFEGFIDLTTMYGKITHDLPLQKDTYSEDNNTIRMAGEVGSGSSRMVIENDRGNIVIRQY
ncbi:MAG: DUF4097 family beta strand repeat-containing protein [Bacteroidota bacterium]